ncbi:MAG TPA: NAD(+)/NADH kinase [Vulgatibacter sp.]|nr:NAD(+)/NADH kinase [Vulgatibacter sp.]
MPSAIERVGIVPRRNHPVAERTSRELCEWLRGRVREVWVEDVGAGSFGAAAVPASELKDLVDLIVVLGGDGTLIHAASLLEGAPIPIVGVNMGSLGFMTEVPVTETYRMLEQVLAGDYEVDRRMKLDVQLLRGDGPPIIEGQVLNDVVISKGALARIADLEATLDGSLVTLYKADGIIVATPTGSTAYSLSADGPIVHPSLDVVVISPICPHTLTQRPIVVPPDRPIHVELKSDNGEVFLTMDGQTGLAMRQGDHVAIRRSEDRVLLVRNPRLDYFSILREKLRWGER